MLNAIPFLGHIISLIINVSLAIPFWVCWTVCGIGKDYFYFMPERYHSIGFWATVGLFTVFGILNQFVPKFVNVSSFNNK